MSESKAIPTGRAHIPVLDGIRGMAILLVMLIHMFVLVPQTPLPTIAFNISMAGWIGVDLFFVLSGFLITGILLDTREQESYFSNFYIRRVCRIFPLFYAVAFFSFVILPYSGLLPITKSARFDTVGSDEIWYWLFLSNFAVANAGVFRHGIMDVTWSLAIEEQFYLFWPFVVRRYAPKLLPLCIALILVSSLGRTIAELAGANRNSLYVLTFFRLDGLAMGAISAVLWRNWGRDARFERLSRWTTIIGLAGFLGCATSGATASYYDSRAMITGGPFFAALFFTGLLGLALLAKPGTGVHRFWTFPPLTFFGTLSYALYLIHLPIRAFMRDRVITPDWIATTPLSGLSGQMLFYFATMAICCAVAWASFHLYEKHFVRLGHRLTSRSQDGTAPTRTVTS